MTKLKTILHFFVKLCIVFYFFISGYNLMNDSQTQAKLFTQDVKQLELITYENFGFHTPLTYLTIRDSNEQIVRVFALLQILTAIYFIMSNKMAIALIVLVLIQMKLSHNPFIVS